MTPGLDRLDEDCRKDYESAKLLDKVRLLVIGMSGLGAVVVKDAMKAGFSSVTMMDHLDWTEEDRASQFLIAPESQEPENRAKASLERAQTLNHQVELDVEMTKVSEVDESFFRNRWDVVVAVNLLPKETLKLNAICRKLGVKFFVTHVFGMFGFFFSDLLDKHAYRKPVRGIYSTYGSKEENMVIRWEQFFPFDAVLNHTFDKVYDFFYASPWYFVMRGLLKFVDKYDRNPTKELADLETVRLLVNDEVEAGFRRDDNKVPSAYIQLCLGPPVPLMCQLVGSMLTKEIIKAATHVEEPYNNIYLFDPVRSKGEIVTIGNS